jgi:Asp-tRNA(Asn)/Glu-tRNA(Gln) amidotransferase A subunit family amidase
MTETKLNERSATELGALLSAGDASAEAIARACLARIAARDPQVRAWSHTDPAASLRQARELDKSPRRGRLHGIPIGVKDMIDTADMPTQHNSPIFAGHRPSLDAACVAILRAAGAIILGKTDTTEFAAAGRWAATRNPHDPARTSGGSSAGSAAAVADFQVPLSLGTQTGGSTIRPASFCGVFALKPSWGAVGREGLKHYSVTLDTLSWFARSLADLALLCDVFDVHDDAPPRPVATRGARIGLCRSPVWDAAGAGTHLAMETAAERLRRAGAVVTDLALPDQFKSLPAMQRTIMLGEGRAAFLSLARTHRHALHDDFLSRAENRTGITRAGLLAAYDHAAACRPVFDAIATDFDAILTPSATDEAPPAGDGPGNPAFNSMWTLLHVPCVNIPCVTGAAGLPVGVTLTTRRFADRQLLATSESLGPVISG